jgi:hypothetical protein
MPKKMLQRLDPPLASGRQNLLQWAHQIQPERMGIVQKLFDIPQYLQMNNRI